MNKINKLAIIPAKKTSIRCVNKNMRIIGGLPLFLHSVNYAYQEGFTPIVSTDSKDVIDICKYRNIEYFEEKVNDNKMENCIKQVLTKYTCDFFAVLQPTSPLRREGLLTEMLELLLKTGAPSCYTAQKIKLVGHLDNKFQQAYREQDSTRFFYFYDGNILICNEQSFKKNNALLSNESIYFINTLPFNLQIDTEKDFLTLSTLTRSSKGKIRLPNSGKTKRVCIIANKKDLKRNYSTFVNSCDVVLRISKMENLDCGLTGNKTDIVLVSCFFGYLAFSAKVRHMDHLREVPEIYFNNEEIRCSIGFAHNEKLDNWKFMPECVHQSTSQFTTLSKALCLADYLYPEAQLYYLGDTDTGVRAPNSKKHNPLPENEYLQNLIKSKRVIHILEDEKKEGWQYSEPNELIQTKSSPSSSDIVKPTYESIINIVHPYWKDQFYINNKRGMRKSQNDHATIIENNKYTITIKWDKWGEEMYIKNEEDIYYLIDYRFNSTISQISKYDEELIISPHSSSATVFRKTSRPFISIGYTNWHYMLQLNRMERDIERQISNMPHLKKVLFIGICKDSLSSLILATRLQKKHPQLVIGVWGCSWAENMANEKCLYKNEVISPALEAIRNKKPFTNLIPKFADTDKLMKESTDVGIKLFGFYGINTNWQFDKDTTEKRQKYLEKVYIYKCNEDEHGHDVHSKIINITNTKHDLYQKWEQEIFDVLSINCEKNKFYAT